MVQRVVSADRMEAYLSMARGTGVFHEDEIDVLEEVLDDAWRNPDTTYTIWESVPDTTAGAPGSAGAEGFILFGRTPMTDFSWDMYWIVVDRNLQGKGVGRKLLECMENELRTREPRSVIRVETSGKGVYEPTRAFYQRTGFTLLGAIPDFYAPGDDLFIFYKVILR